MSPVAIQIQIYKVSLDTKKKIIDEWLSYEMNKQAYNFIGIKPNLAKWAIPIG